MVESYLITLTEISIMKKFVLLLILIMFLSGCLAAARESEFFDHPCMYKNLDHLKFSWSGYRHPSEDTYQKTVEQKWWGKPVLYEPGK